MLKHEEAASPSRPAETALAQHIRRYRQAGLFPLGFVGYRSHGAEAPEILVNPCGKALIGRANTPGSPLVGDQETWTSLGNELVACMRAGWRLLGLIVVDREERPLLEWVPGALWAYVIVLEQAHPPVLRHQERAWRLELLAHARQDVQGRVLKALRAFAKDVGAYFEECLDGEAGRPVPSALAPWPRMDVAQDPQDEALNELMNAPAKAFPVAVRWSWKRTQ